MSRFAPTTSCSSPAVRGKRRRYVPSKLLFKREQAWPSGARLEGLFGAQDETFRISNRQSRPTLKRSWPTHGTQSHGVQVCGVAFAGERPGGELRQPLGLLARSVPPQSDTPKIYPRGAARGGTDQLGADTHLSRQDFAGDPEHQLP